MNQHMHLQLFTSLAADEAPTVRHRGQRFSHPTARSASHLTGRQEDPTRPAFDTPRKDARALGPGSEAVYVDRLLDECESRESPFGVSLHRINVRLFWPPCWKLRQSSPSCAVWVAH